MMHGDALFRLRNFLIQTRVMNLENHIKQLELFGNAYLKFAEKNKSKGQKSEVFSISSSISRKLLAASELLLGADVYAELLEQKLQPHEASHLSKLIGSYGN